MCHFFQINVYWMLQYVRVEISESNFNWNVLEIRSPFRSREDWNDWTALPDRGAVAQNGYSNGSPNTNLTGGTTFHPIRQYEWLRNGLNVETSNYVLFWSWNHRKPTHTQCNSPSTEIPGWFYPLVVLVSTNL
jgi:hypothetical protein